VFEDTNKRDYRYVRAGLLRRGWQQITLPHQDRTRGSTPKRDGGSSWVHHGGAMGVSSLGQKDITCPDLIWTRSGLLPGRVGPGQATNFFASSCLTTKVRCIFVTNNTEKGPQKRARNCKAAQSVALGCKPMDLYTRYYLLVYSIYKLFVVHIACMSTLAFGLHAYNRSYKV